MSKLYKDPLSLQGLKCDITDQDIVVSKNDHANTVRKHSMVNVWLEDGMIYLKPKDIHKRESRMHTATLLRLVKNAVAGIVQPFHKTLVLFGVGYRALIQDRTIQFYMNFSHEVKYTLPAMIDVSMQDNKLTFSSINKDLLGKVCSSIQRLRKPDAYKGKGVRYENVLLTLKQVKK